jgi:hypothetical protein
MIKMQVYLRDEQKSALRKMAARTGTAESDLVRQGVDLMLEKKEKDVEGWREATRAAAGMWKDRDLSFFDDMRKAVKRRLPHVYGDKD